MKVPDRVWRIARIVGPIAVAAGTVFALRSVNWKQTSEALGQANGGWLAAAVGANACILVCWAAFWRTIRPAGEPPIGYGRMLEVVSTASALMNTLPFGGGHASSIALLIRRADSSQRGAMSTVALDQLGEGIAKVGVFVLAGFLVPLPPWMRAGITTATLAVAAWLLTLVVASRYARELEIFRSWRPAVRALACVGGMKLAQLAAIVAVQRAYGVDVSVGGSLLVLASVLLGTMVSLSPGNVGAFEASAFFAYRHLGVSPEQALSVAIVQHLCFMLPAVGVGYVVYSAQALSRRAIASR